MSAAVLLAALVVSSVGFAASGQDTATQTREVIADIRIHGNLTISDEEVRQLAGVAVGSPLGPDTIAEVTARLRRTGRFERVEVLKRFASIADPTAILLVIVVDEGAVKIERTADPDHPTRVVKRRGPNVQFLPIVTAEDGYGLIYGARLGLADPAGARSRLSFPLTWGGDKHAAAELEKDVGSDGLTRLSGGASIDRRTHPHFDRDEDRQAVWAGVARNLTRAVRVSGTAGWQHVSFLDATDSFTHVGADVVLDTRLDPMLARNAVYGRAAVQQYGFSSGGSNTRIDLDGRGYIGLVGQSVLVLRAIREDAAHPLPVYLKPMLGGLANVRGFAAGTAIGDTLVATTAELRLPITSPLNIGKIGVSAFVDAGTVYDKGQRLADQSWRQGVGGAVWLSATIIRLNLAVAHGLGASTRVHFGGSLSF